MGKHFFDGIKKITSLLLAILFVVSLTAASAGATSLESNTLSDIDLGNSTSIFDLGSFLSGFGIIDNILSSLGIDDIMSGIFGFIPSQ